MLEYIPITKKHEQLLIELTKASFNRETPAHYYAWKYFENPKGNVVGYAAYDKAANRFAAYYGVIPESYSYNGNKIKVYQSCDTMTHPDYRRKGLFVKLAQLCYDELEKRGDFIVKGFAGKLSFPGFISKLNWIEVDQITPLFKIRAQINMSALKHKSLNSEEHIEELSEITAGHEQFITNYKTPTIFTKVRDVAYLNWRLKEPKKTSKVVLLYKRQVLQAYAFYTIEGSLLLLRDVVIEQSNKQMADKIFDYLERKVLQEGLKGIYSWSNKNSMNHQLLKNQKFIKNPLGIGPMTEKLYFIIKQNNHSSQSLKASANSSWNLLPLEYDF